MSKTVADVLMEYRERPYGRLSRAQVMELLDRIESALAAGAEPARTEFRGKKDGSEWGNWLECKTPGVRPNRVGAFVFEYRDLYAHAQPAAKVEVQPYHA